MPAWLSGYRRLESVLICSVRLRRSPSVAPLLKLESASVAEQRFLPALHCWILVPQSSLVCSVHFLRGACGPSNDWACRPQRNIQALSLIAARGKRSGCPLACLCRWCFRLRVLTVARVAARRLLVPRRLMVSLYPHTRTSECLRLLRRK